MREDIVMLIKADSFKQALKDIANKIEVEKEYLSELDRAIGDGDHGVTMSIGWKAVVEKLNTDLKEEEDCGEICKVVAKTFLNAVGSSVGPLYATAFLRGSKVLQGKTELNDEDLYKFWISAGKGIQERGKAEVGDKTMWDTISPAVQALEQSYEQGEDFLTGFRKAVASGEEGMKSTKDMISKKGRSSRLGERSLGNQDPGATSAYFILSAFLQYLENVRLKHNV